MRGGRCSRPPTDSAQARLELRALIEARNSQEAAAQCVNASKLTGLGHSSVGTLAGSDKRAKRLWTELHDGWWPGVARL